MNVLFAQKSKNEYERHIDANFFKICLSNLLKESHTQHKDVLLRFVDGCSMYTKPIDLNEAMIIMIIEKSGYFNGIDGVLKVFGHFSKNPENIGPFFNQGLLNYICTSFDPLNTERLTLINVIFKNFYTFCLKKQEYRAVIKSTLGKSDSLIS